MVARKSVKKGVRVDRHGGRIERSDHVLLRLGQNAAGRGWGVAGGKGRASLGYWGAGFHRPSQDLGGREQSTWVHGKKSNGTTRFLSGPARGAPGGDIFPSLGGTGTWANGTIPSVSAEGEDQGTGHSGLGQRRQGIRSRQVGRRRHGLANPRIAGPRALTRGNKNGVVSATTLTRAARAVGGCRGSTGLPDMGQDLPRVIHFVDDGGRCSRYQGSGVGNRATA